MRPRSPLNGFRYQLRWKLRVLRSNLEVTYEEAKDWFKARWGKPAVFMSFPLRGALVRGGRQRLEFHVEEAEPSRVVTAYLLAAEELSADERHAVRRVHA